MGEENTRRFVAKAREMVERNRTAIGDPCSYSTYADRLLDAVDMLEKLEEKNGWMFGDLEDALQSLVAHPQVRTVALNYNLFGGGKWECRVMPLGNELSLPAETLRSAEDPLDACIEARDAFRANNHTPNQSHTE